LVTDCIWPLENLVLLVMYVWPELNGVYNLGHLFLKVVGLPPLYQHTVSPFDPLSPSIPGVPFTPGTPSSPFIPFKPGRPTDPGMPSLPGTPVKPLVPFSPVGPRLPGGPTMPAEERVIVSKIKIKESKIEKNESVCVCLWGGLGGWVLFMCG